MKNYSMNYINLIASICSIVGLIITIINIIITGSIKRSIINRKSRKDYEKIKKDIYKSRDEKMECIKVIEKRG